MTKARDIRIFQDKQVVAAMRRRNDVPKNHEEIQRAIGNKQLSRSYRVSRRIAWLDR